MSISEAFRLALRRLRSNKLRTGLTTLGIIIGAGSLVALLAVGQGAQQRITSRIASLGTNLLSVQAGAAVGQGGIRGGLGSASTLTMQDADALRALPGVAAVAPELPVGNALVVAGRANTTTQVTGTTSDEAQVRGYDLAAGAFLSQIEVSKGLRVAVLGATAASDLGLAGSQAVGQAIQINAIPFQVVGVAQPKGGFGNPDDVVFVPLGAVERRLSGSSSLRSIGISVKGTGDMTAVSQQAEQVLRARHNLATSASDDFLINNQAQLLQVASDQATVLRNFLLGIAAIALVVGGIGIANIMLVAVRERTREIGIRKAIGARRRDLSRQFLVEAVVVSLAGGVLGALVGVLSAGLVGRAVRVTARPSLSGVLLAFASSALVGAIAGWWPARQAALLDPVEALRYE